jgi:protein-tyrosine phosphatase
MSFELLFVCHANLCRSPLAERLAGEALRATLRAGSEGFAVASAGTHARDGRPMHPYAERVLTELGLDGAGFGSRTVTAPMLTRSHLVLTATREQRAHCVALAPVAVRRTFTLLQFARLASLVVPDKVAGVDPAERAEALLGEVLAVRGTAQPVPVALDDLADPVGRPVESFRACARDIHAAVSAVVRLIAPA